MAGGLCKDSPTTLAAGELARKERKMQHKEYTFDKVKRGFGSVWRVISPDGIVADFCKSGHTDYQASVEAPGYVSEIGVFGFATSMAKNIIAIFKSGNIKSATKDSFGPLNEV